MSFRRWIASLVAVALMASCALAGEPKCVLLLGQKRDHPPKTHEYMAGVKLLAQWLEDIPGIEVSVHQADEPWPEGPGLIDRADAVVLYLGQGARWEQNDPKRLAALERLAKRKGAIIGIHWAIGAKDAKYIEAHLKLMGGCHGGPDRKYIVCETDVRVAHAKHPITRGIDDFRLNDEYYYKLKFAKAGKIEPILQAAIEGKPETVAWAFERPDGGRSFGFAGMHFHANWGRIECRRLIVQGILWTLDTPIPEQGLQLGCTEEDLRLP